MHANDSVQTLYKKWQRGDSDAGDSMADRFELWFNTLTVFHLGANGYKESYEKACKQFSNEILNVKRPSELIPFAHKIVQNNITEASNAKYNGDYTNAMLQNRSPQSLIQSIWTKLSTSDQRLLKGLYGNEDTIDNLKTEIQPKEGLAYASLCARQRLKKLLHEEKQVTFSFMTDSEIWDLCPLPLFESGTLRNDVEYQHFERWLLTMPSICKDIIEFAPFVHTMKSGALTKIKSAPKKQSSTTSRKQPVPESASVSSKDNNYVKIALMGVILAIVLFAIAVLFKTLLGES